MGWAGVWRRAGVCPLNLCPGFTPRTGTDMWPLRKISGFYLLYIEGEMSALFLSDSCKLPSAFLFPLICIVTHLIIISYLTFTSCSHTSHVNEHQTQRSYFKTVVCTPPFISLGSVKKFFFMFLKVFFNSVFYSVCFENPMNNTGYKTIYLYRIEFSNPNIYHKKTINKLLKYISNNNITLIN